MTDLRSLLEREALEVDPHPDAYLRVLRAAETRRRRRAAATIVTALVIAGVGTVAAVMGLGRLGGARPAGGDDSYRGVECISEDEPGLITCHEAIDRAFSESGSPESLDASSADAHLDLYAIRRGEDPTRAWVITYHDVVRPIHGPLGRGPHCGIGDWNIAINARTGQYISEGGSARPIECPPRSQDDWATVEVERFDSSIGVPPGWHVQEFDEEIGGLFHFAGVLVSNVDFTFAHPDLGPDSHTSAWDMRELPSNAVVVMFSHGVRLSICNENARGTDFPLALRDARPVSYTEESYGAPEPRLYRPVTVDGDPHYQLDVWFGADASDHDRELAEDIVASIEKPKPLTCDLAGGPSPAPSG